MSNDLDLSPDEQFDRTFKFKDIDLNPFTESRKGLFGSCGAFKWEPGTDQASAVIYICFIDKKQVSKAKRNLDRFQEEMDAWCDENIKTEDYPELSTLAGEILKNAFSTKAAPVPTEGGTPEMGNF